MKQSAIFIKKENLLSVLALIAVNTFSVGSASAIGLLNPSFEADSVSTLPALIPGNGNYESSSPTRPTPGFVITNQSNITGWRTDAGDAGIEIWQSGFNGVNTAPGNGGQFAEINATQASSTFQDLTIGASVGTTTLYFNFWHRARENGNPIESNAITLTITDLGTDNAIGGIGGAADTPLYTQLYQTSLDTTVAGYGTTGNNGWVNYSGQSGVTAGFSAAAAGTSRNLRFSYAATTTGTTTNDGNLTSGNFLDNANFGDNPTFGVPFDFSPNLAIGVLGGLYLGRRVLKSLKKKKDID